MDLLAEMADPRDNRGKRHDQSFIIGAVILAILSGRNYTSEIHRYINNRIEWLRKVLGHPNARKVSRAQLPRILSIVDWDDVNSIVEAFFNVRIDVSKGKWRAVDGKSLRGTISDKTQAHHHEQIVTVVAHDTQEILFQRKLSGSKDSEISVVRELLTETGLDKGKITLDAHHLNPTTLSQIHQSGGIYLTQVKNNQPRMLDKLKSIEADGIPNGVCKGVDKGHGRIEKREGRFFSLQSEAFDSRWKESGLNVLIVMDRITTDIKKGRITSERSYYISNERGGVAGKIGEGQKKELFNAIRNHWKVESNNHIRDVTFREDAVKTRNQNQGQVMSLLRTVAIKLIRKTGTDNFKEIIDSFKDSKKNLKKFLKNLNFC